MNCAATWSQAHGIVRCDKLMGHDAKHHGLCWICLEDGDDPEMVWG